MSNFLAIATATTTLQRILEEEIKKPDNDPGKKFSAGVEVTIDRPDNHKDESERQKPRVNIYLYQVSPNAAWRNADLPALGADGKKFVQRPQIALDLHYMLTFYGIEEQLEPQRLLALAVRTLHARPVLTRQEITNVVEKAKAPQNPKHPYLANSDLAAQVELVKFSPVHLNLEELSKLWSVFFQIPYSLSVAYQGSVVLIESEETPKAALPVADRGIHSAPQLPTIEKMLSQKDDNAAARENQPIFAGDQLILLGKGFLSERTFLQFDDAEVPADELEEVSDTRVKFKLESPPIPEDLLRPGKHGVRVVQKIDLRKNENEPPDLRKAFESNAAFFILQPSVESVTVE